MAAIPNPELTYNFSQTLSTYNQFFSATSTLPTKSKAPNFVEVMRPHLKLKRKVVSAVPEVTISFLGESLLQLSSNFAKKLIWGTSDLYKLPTVAKAF
jgi:hypothetical protein